MPAAARFAGEGRLTWWGFTVYDARLWVAPEFTSRQLARHAFALELTYLRNLRADDIVRTTLEEMRRTADIPDDTAARWAAQLRPLLRDVKTGDRIAAVNRPGRGAAFFVNGKTTGDIADPQFAQRFFAIWLAPTTSEPGLRAALLGDTVQ
ncbi:MAG: chalcone isomerase family protein [Ramlibacter sp.]|nr:chalcone isomerase family protein [Ramlibacter sp.]